MKILFVVPGAGAARGQSPRLASFHETDLQLLQDLGHEVQTILWRGRPFWQLLKGARGADVVYCWNISDYAFASTFAARRLVCVVGGFEFANLPEYGYGNMISRRMRFITKWVWRRADALLYVDPSLEDEATQAFGSPGRAHYVPTGYDPAFWTPGEGPREDLAVTVCHALTRERLALKGVDLFLEVARVNPDLEFHVVGQLPTGMPEGRLGPNVVADGWLDALALRDLYRRAKVYCQFSVHEGLPNAVCEAMLCGCIPLGTAVNGIPTAIGDAGFIVERHVEEIGEVLRQAVANSILGPRARERIMRLFPVRRREAGLQEILESLVPGRGQA